MRITNESNVGIGTTVPIAKLTINSSSMAGTLLVQNTTGGTQLFVNGTNGYVGIGTLSTTERLTIGGNSTSSLGLRPTDSPAGYGVVINATFSAAHSFSITTYPNSAERIGVYQSNLVLNSANNNNVGIGITTPSEKLTVNGNLSATNAYVTNLNATTTMYEAGSRVCTGANGLCNLSLSTIDTNMGNASKHVANCGVNTVIQNITATGIQCVSDQTGGGGGGTNGSGAAGYITMWNGTLSMNSSVIYQNGANIGIGTTGAAQKLVVSGDLNVTGNIYIHGNVTGYDLAEYISGDGTLEAGDVVEIDTTRLQGFTKSKSAYNTKVAGIVSTDPGLNMNRKDDLTNKVPLALSGRVPIKVTTEGGNIVTGDLLTTSSTPGYAMKCGDRSKCFGALVGKALEPYSSQNPGMITALVTLG